MSEDPLYLLPGSEITRVDEEMQHARDFLTLALLCSLVLLALSLLALLLPGGALLVLGAWLVGVPVSIITLVGLT